MIISRAPLRISFLGGGTDYLDHFRDHGGAVLGTAVDKYAFITANPYLTAFHGHRYKLSYSETEHANNIDDIAHPLLREAIRIACPDKEVEVHYIADLPARTGLGSSSSFLVALLQALHGYMDEDAPPEQLAREAIQIERHILSEAGGCQDQILSAYGGISLVEFSGDEQFVVKQIPVEPARLESINDHCLILYTGLLRNSFDVAQKQHKKTSTGLNTELLNELTRLARDGADFISGSEPVAGFGEYLKKGWELKKQLGDITLPEIDETYNEAMSCGALGGKLLGAGQGGFILLWAEPKKHQAIMNGMSRKMPRLDVRVGAPGATLIHTF